MEYEDSRNALFVEPNAYIQHYDDKKKEQGIKKIIFSEPYESAPPMYYNSNHQNSGGGVESRGQTNSNFQNNQSQNNSNFSQPQNNFRQMFDFKNIMSLLGALGKGKSDLGGMMKLLGGNQGQEKSSSMGLNSILSLLQNKDLLSGLLNMFSKPKKNKSAENNEKSTDFVIKNYTRVEN